MNAEDFIKELRPDAEKTFGDKALSVLDYIKEAFMGRRLSMTFGRERVAEYKKNIMTYTEEVMKLTPDTNPKDIKNEELKNAFTTVLRIAKTSKIDVGANFDKIQKVLIQSYIVGEGFKNEGSNWSGSIGLLMLAGVHRDEISSDVAKTKHSLYNDAENEVLSPAPAKKPVATQTVQDVVNLRERETKLNNKPFADLLYSMGHDKRFNEFIGLLARQDFVGATTWLNGKGKKGYQKLATRLLKEKNTVDMSTWTSYMYGSSESRAKQAYSQEYADKKVRTKATIASEARLAKQLGISASAKEAELKVGTREKYTPMQASGLFPGQGMTIASFTTPKGGLHRIDTYDGSVTMSNKTTLITSQSEKASIIRAILSNTSEKRGVQKNLEDLNSQLKLDIKMNQYVAYLASGKIEDLGVPGLVLQPGKEPKIFEGRAMIAGNVCLNRLYGIVYPAFMLGGVTQEVAPVVPADYSTPLNEVSVNTLQSVA